MSNCVYKNYYSITSGEIVSEYMNYDKIGWYLINVFNTSVNVGVGMSQKESRFEIVGSQDEKV